MATKFALLLTATFVFLARTSAGQAIIEGYIGDQCNSEEQWSVQGAPNDCISLTGQPEANSIIAQAPEGQVVILYSDSYCQDTAYTVSESETYCYNEASRAIGSVGIVQEAPGTPSTYWVV